MMPFLTNRVDKNNNKKIVWIGFTFSVFFFLVFIFTKNIIPKVNPVNNTSNSPIPIQKEGGMAFLEIENKKIETTITKNETIYDFMSKLKGENKIDFKEKNYSGMGKLIEEINGIKNGDKNWIYYVNGKKANIGISNYKINPGDVVSWKYEINIY